MEKNKLSSARSWKLSLGAVGVTVFLSMLGAAQFLPFLPLYVADLGEKSVARVASWSGMIFGVSFFFTGFMGPVWGNYADRYGRKINLLRALAGSGLCLLLMSQARNVFDLFFLRMLQGALGGFVSASTALAATVVPREKMGFALGALHAAAMAGLIGGPLLGGFLVDRWGFERLILLSVGLMAAGALLTFLFVTEDRSALQTSRHPYALRDNFKFVFGKEGLLCRRRT